MHKGEGEQAAPREITTTDVRDAWERTKERLTRVRATLRQHMESSADVETLEIFIRSQVIELTERAQRAPALRGTRPAPTDIKNAMRRAAENPGMAVEVEPSEVKNSPAMVDKEPTK